MLTALRVRSTSQTRPYITIPPIWTTSMPNIDEKMHCRVCGVRLPVPPWGEDGMTPTFDYCPCCGVEFGYGDSSAPAVECWRAKWLSGGAHWAEPDQKPSDWNPEEQLRNVPSS